MSFLKDGLARVWAKTLADATGEPVFPNRREGRPDLPFSVVVVKRLMPIMPGENAHRAEVRIVHVSDAVDSTAEDHRRRVGALHAAIEATPRPAIDLDTGLVLCGFIITAIEQVSGSGDDDHKVISDVFMIDAGVKGEW